jgi:hypothetical protein
MRRRIQDTRRYCEGYRGNAFAAGLGGFLERDDEREHISGQAQQREEEPTPLDLS